jgi:signal transduction histidine kinase
MMQGHAAQSGNVPGAALVLCMSLLPGSLANSWEGRLAIYILPFAVAGAAVMFVLWRVRNQDAGRRILSHLELELKDAADLEDRQEIEQCISGAKRISSTLHGLVNYARPGPLVLSKISLHRLIEDTLAFLEHQPILRGKQLENTVPRDLPNIRADANQLSQVLMNLLLNAAEATPEGGRISITASKLTFVDMIEIRVSDTGCGIPPDILAHVFEPFFTTKRGRGTGLGLSISQAYVRSHNGEIRVDSVLHHGTTVTLTLPIRNEEVIENAKEESEMIV